MKSISGKQLCRIVEQKSWMLKRVPGSHRIYEHPEFDEILSIPVHRNRDLKIGMLRALMKVAELAEEDLNQTTALDRG